MPASTRLTQVGIQACTLYPYGGPYDNTTAEPLYGLQYVDISVNSTDAQGFGGESIYEIFSAEVKREIEVKFSGFELSLRLMQMIAGGDFVFDAADGAANTDGTHGDEVQIYNCNLNDRASLFRMVAQSNLGNGVLNIVFPKLRLQGNITWNMRAEAIHMPEMSARALFDKTYVRQDGKTGTPYEWFYGNGGQNTRHS